MCSSHISLGKVLSFIKHLPHTCTGPRSVLDAGGQGGDGSPALSPSASEQHQLQKAVTAPAWWDGVGEAAGPRKATGKGTGFCPGREKSSHPEGAMGASTLLTSSNLAT